MTTLEEMINSVAEAYACELEGHADVLQRNADVSRANEKHESLTAALEAGARSLRVQAGVVRELGDGKFMEAFNAAFPPTPKAGKCGCCALEGFNVGAHNVDVLCGTCGHPRSQHARGML